MELFWGFVTGMVGYPLLEILWRGYSHITMAFAGGICLLGIYLIAGRFMSEGIFYAAFLGAALVTAVELIFGLVFNVAAGMNIWDYSSRPFNFLGQICIEYFLLWYALCLLLMPLCRAVHRVFG